MSNYWFNFEKKKLYFSIDLLLGHNLKESTFNVGYRLFLGTRKNKLLYNHDYLFFNFIKKIALLKNLINNNFEFVFITARREFAYIIKKYAAACGCKSIIYLNVNDIGKFLEERGSSDKDWLVFLLFNNDNNISANCVQELIKKKCIAFSVMDTNALGADYFFNLYGNDDSIRSLCFYAKLLSELIINKKKNLIFNEKKTAGGNRIFSDQFSLKKTKQKTKKNVSYS